MDLPDGEFELIESIRRRVPLHPNVDVGIGDDAACLAAGDVGRLVTTDMLLEGVHFLIPPATPRQVAAKAVNVNLSDIAAMGGIPSAVFVSICWPRSRDARFRDEFCRGLEDACSRFSVSLAGGDTNSWDGPLVISVTALGKLSGPPWLRSGARPGDWIMVTGALGGSLAGHHLDFTPRVAESQALRQICHPTSMIDISDGLAADLFHILEESKVSAILWGEKIPVSPAAQAHPDGRTPLEHALGDGEDFELLFTVSPESGQFLLGKSLIGVPVTHIGMISEDGQSGIQFFDGSCIPLTNTGWKHLF